MFIKKSIILFLALGITISLSACFKMTSQSHPGPSPNQSSASTPSTSGSASNANANANANDDAAIVSGGTLYQLNLKEGESPIIRGIALDGNRVGLSIEENGHLINGRPIGDKNIRSIFELNEWVSVRLDASKTSGLSAAIVPHVADPATFTENFVDRIPENAPRFDLNPPEDVEGNPSWGDAYLHPDDWKAGDYDLVILSDNIPTARVVLKFFDEAGLSGKTDSELEKLMLNP